MRPAAGHDGHGDQTADGHAGEQRVAEQQQGREGGADRHPGDEHRAPGGVERPPEDRAQVGAATGGCPFLAEPGQHEQAVVDAQAQAEHGDDVDREVADRRNAGHSRECQQGDGDRGERGDHRQRPRHQAAERQGKQQHEHDQRHALTPCGVLDGLVGEGAFGHQVAADGDVGERGLAQGVGDPVGDGERLVVAQLRVELDLHDSAAAVLGHQLVGTGRPRVAEVDDTRELAHLEEHHARRVDRRGLERVGAGEHRHHLLALRLERVEPLLDRRRLGTGTGTDVLGPVEDRPAEHGPGHDQHRPYGQHHHAPAVHPAAQPFQHAGDSSPMGGCSHGLRRPAPRGAARCRLHLRPGGRGDRRGRPSRAGSQRDPPGPAAYDVGLGARLAHPALPAAGAGQPGRGGRGVARTRRPALQRRPPRAERGGGGGPAGLPPLCHRGP